METVRDAIDVGNVQQVAPPCVLTNALWREREALASVWKK